MGKENSVGRQRGLKRKKAENIIMWTETGGLLMWLLGHGFAKGRVMVG